MNTPEAPDLDALGREIARLATEHLGASFFASPNPGPSAAAVGAGGASPSVVLPPVPGVVQTPPLPNSPLPRESDARTAPNTLAQGVGLPPPVLVAAQATPNETTPYFLSVAGLPSSVRSEAPDALPTPDAPSSPPYSGSSVEPAWLATDLSTTAFRPELAPNVPLGGTPGTLFDANAVRRDFPILEERVHGGKRLVWLDNAATTQKPRAVIERLSYFYEHENSNIHRAAHALAARATDAYEAAREKTRAFLNAPSAKNVVFVRGGTEAINLVAQSWGRKNIGPGDEIVITWLEHHANIVPWQQLAQEKGAVLRVVPVDDDGQILLEAYERLLGPKTRFVSLTHVSNALGTVVPAREMTAMAHRYGARVLVDGAQAVSHMPVDVQALDCDFYCFSGHKVFAPTGIGALYGKSDVLETMPPWQGGGNMIEDVTFEKTRYQGAPARFEAGTGNIADAVGLGAALDYVTAIGMETVSRYEHELLVYATERLVTVPGLKLIGTAPDKAGVLSFVLDGKRTEDVGAALDQEGIAVRSGHHCAQPILRRFGLESTVRASLALYNTCEDIDALVATLLALQSSSYFRGR
ncbi:MAG TPA: family 2A encapsulin nanocompartment cargo protein cysteine desulfurase [Polyangiaceae bacterium]|nr:family 2A encapsulin nanocompartment cargo protein cysteine desulfurase [Polyangiaceae bacterium]